MSWRRYFRRRPKDEELVKEIDLYLAEEIDENIGGLI
jgi:hypothetical protein